jgi:hypothetical protein
MSYQGPDLRERQTNAANLVNALVRRYDIDCEWQQNGYIHAAAPGGLTPHQAP